MLSARNSRSRQSRTPFATAATQSDAELERILQRREIHVKKLLQELRKLLWSRGQRAAYSLQRNFYQFDTYLSGKISQGNFQKVLKQFRTGFTDDDIEHLSRHYDQFGTSQIPYKKILEDVTGPLTDDEKWTVNKIFDLFPKAVDGRVISDHFRYSFEATKHPFADQENSEQILQDFLDTFPFDTRSPAISRLQFMEYCSIMRFHFGPSDDQDSHESFMTWLACWSVGVPTPQSPKKNMLSQQERLIVSSSPALIGIHGNDDQLATARERNAGEVKNNSIQLDSTFRPSQPQGVPPNAHKMTTNNDNPRSVIDRFKALNLPTSVQLSVAEMMRIIKSYLKGYDHFAGRGGFSSTAAINRLEQTNFNHALPHAATTGSPGLSQHFVDGLAGRTLPHLARAFRHIDAQRNGKITFRQFWEVLNGDTAMARQVGIGQLIGEENARRLFESLDTHAEGCINYEAFIFSIRGQLSERRKKLVDQAWKKLDPQGTGSVSFQALQRAYRIANEIPARNTILGYASHPESLPSYDPSSPAKVHQITRGDFEDYYANLSASMEDNDYFALVLWKEWDLSQYSSQQNYAVLPSKRNSKPQQSTSFDLMVTGSSVREAYADRASRSTPGTTTRIW